MINISVAIHRHVAPQSHLYPTIKRSKLTNSMDSNIVDCSVAQGAAPAAAPASSASAAPKAAAAAAAAPADDMDDMFGGDDEVNYIC